MSDFWEQRAVNRIFRWYHQRRFITAYKILRNAKERHAEAGHDVRFKAINEAYVLLECVNCPDFRIPRSLDRPGTAGHQLISYPQDDGWIGQCECGWLVVGALSLDRIVVDHGTHLKAVKE